MGSRTLRALDDMCEERQKQDQKWGVQHHIDLMPCTKKARTLDEEQRKRECKAADNNGTLTWEHILNEEVAEAYNAKDVASMRQELVQAAAVLVAWIEDIDSRGQPK